MEIFEIEMRNLFVKSEAGAQLKPVFSGFETRLQFSKFGLR